MTFKPDFLAGVTESETLLSHGGSVEAGVACENKKLCCHAETRGVVFC